MGSSYSNLTLRGPDPARVAAVLRGRGLEAYVGPAENGFTVVFESDAEHDPDAMRRLAADLSEELGCAVLAVTVHDDDVLLYALCRGGAVLDEFDSAPGYPTSMSSPASGGNATVLCRTMGSPDAALGVKRVLRAAAKSARYARESARHRDLAEALGLPSYGIGLGFGYVFQGDAEDLEERLTWVGVDESPDEGDVLARPGGGHPAETYFAALAAGDAEPVRALFAGPPRIDDPRSGRVEGDVALTAHVARTREWLKGAAYSPTGGVEDGARVVTEGELRMEGPAGPLALPVCCVWDRAPGGGYAAVRVYHSLWPLTGAHRVRGPLLPVRDDLVVPAEVARYQQALAAGDLERIMEAFGEFCVVREPSGGDYFHVGRAAARSFYRALFGAGGGIPLSHCTLTADGTRCALEYVVTRWGRTALPPQAGVAVYERQPGGDVLWSARIYDDVEPPSSA